MPEGKLPEICAGAVVTRVNELLLVRRANPPSRDKWSVPGGRVRFGESLAEAAVRELEEETGLHGVCGPMLGWTEIIGPDHHFVVIDFEVVLVGGEDPVAGDDALDAAWVPVWSVAEMDLAEGLAEFLADHGIIDAIS